MLINTPWGFGGDGPHAIFAMGNTTTTTNKYTYSSDAVAPATSLTADLRVGAAASNGTTGVNI